MGICVDGYTFWKKSDKDKESKKEKKEIEEKKNLCDECENKKDVRRIEDNWKLCRECAFFNYFVEEDNLKIKEKVKTIFGFEKN